MIIELEANDIKEHEKHLEAFVVASKALYVVELGTRQGVSTRALLKGLAKTNGILTTIDIDDCSEYVKGLACEFIHGDDMKVPLPTREIDLLFIDSSHQFDHTLAEHQRWVPCVKEGGFILLHDMNYDGVLDAVKAFCQYEGYQYLWDRRQNGLGVIIKCKD